MNVNLREGIFWSQCDWSEMESQGVGGCVGGLVGVGGGGVHEDLEVSGVSAVMFRTIMIFNLCFTVMVIPFHLR